MVNDMTGLSSPRRTAAVDGCAASPSTWTGRRQPGRGATPNIDHHGPSRSPGPRLERPTCAARDVVTADGVGDVYLRGWRAAHARVVAAIALADHGGPLRGRAGGAARGGQLAGNRGVKVRRQIDGAPAEPAIDWTAANGGKLLQRGFGEGEPRRADVLRRLIAIEVKTSAEVVKPRGVI